MSPKKLVLALVLSASLSATSCSKTDGVVRAERPGAVPPDAANATIVWTSGIPGGLQPNGVEAGSDAVSPSESLLYEGRAGDARSSFVLRDLGVRTLDEIGAPDPTASTVNGQDQVQFTEGSRSSIAWVDGVDRHAYLITGSLERGLLGRIAATFSHEGSPGPWPGPHDPEGAWNLIGQADAISYWSLFSEPSSSPPLGSKRFMFVDPSAPSRTLGITISQGSPGEAEVLAALMPAPRDLGPVSGRGTGGHASCQTSACEAGAGVWASSGLTVVMQWTGLSRQIIEQTLASMVVGS